MGQLGVGSLDINHTGVPQLVTALEGQNVVELCGWGAPLIGFDG